MSLAGSAIKQNVGDLTKWDQWKPDNRKYGWLLIAGATNPPENIDTSQRRSKEEKSGQFLEGTKYDMQIMEEFVKKKSLGNLQNTLRMLDMEKQEVIKRLKKFFEWCKKNEYKPALLIGQITAWKKMNLNKRTIRIFSFTASLQAQNTQQLLTFLTKEGN